MREIRSLGCPASGRVVPRPYSMMLAAPSTGFRDLARLLAMSAGATTQLRTSSSPVSRSLVSAAAACALLLQALLGMPLALRMTADAAQWLQLSGSICAATTDSDPLANDHRPIRQAPTHDHAQCLICQAHALPLGLLTVALCALVALFRHASRCSSKATGSPWRHDRNHSYHSRAPPVAA